MATIRKRNGQWQVQVRRRGFDPVSKTFQTRQEATGWARQIEGDMDRSVYVPRKAAESMTLKALTDRYLEEVAPLKKRKWVRWRYGSQATQCPRQSDRHCGTRVGRPRAHEPREGGQSPLSRARSRRPRCAASTVRQIEPRHCVPRCAGVAFFRHMNSAHRARPLRDGVVGIAAFVLAAALLSAHAQAPAVPKPKRVAIPLEHSSAPDANAAARKGWGSLFAEQGLVDGRDIEITIYRPRSYDPEDRRAVAREVVASRPDLIVTHYVAFLPPLREHTREIPIVTFIVESGLEDYVASLRRPGGNVTGMTVLASQEMGRTAQLLLELRPGAKRLAIVTLGRPGDTDASKWMRDALRKMEPRLREVLGGLGIELVWIEGDFGSDRVEASTLDAIRKAKVDFAVVSCQLVPKAGPPFWEALAKLRVAVLTDCGEGVKNGALAARWAVLHLPATLVRLAARILRGESPAAIPVEQPREIRTMVNLRTARALGLTVPPSVRIEATEVFE